MRLATIPCVMLVTVLGIGCADRGSLPGTDERSRDILTPVGVPFRISDDPTLVVGLDDDVPLYRVNGGVLLPDGVAVTNGNEVLIFDTRGALVARQGQTGQGPGDYRSLYGLTRYGSGLLAWDIGLLRLTLLDADGEFTGVTTQIHPRSSPGAPMIPTLVGAFGKSVLLQYESMGLPGEGVVSPHETRLEELFEVYDVGSGELAFQTLRPGREEWSMRTEDTHGGLPVVFGRTAVAGVAHGRAYLATTDSLTLTEVNENGERRTISLPHRPIHATESWASMVKDSLRTRIGTSTSVSARFNQRLLEDLPARTTLPSFSALKGGRDGRLWIRSYPVPDQDYVIWVALDDAWKPHLWVSIPKSAKVLDLGKDRVLLRDEGPFGEEVVKVHAFVR